MSEKIYGIRRLGQARSYQRRQVPGDVPFLVSDPNGFWASRPSAFDWMKPFHKVENVSYAPATSRSMVRGWRPERAWNCIDRHLDKRGHQTPSSGRATIPRSPSNHLRHCTTKSARWPTSCAQDVRRATVKIYLPMIPEAVLRDAGLRAIGAIHSVVFAGFYRRQPCPAHHRLPVQGHHHRRRGMRGGKRCR